MSTTSASPSRRQFVVSQELVLLVALAVALGILSVTANHFMTVGNLLNQGRLMTEVALVALPMTFIIITGGIDLSVGSMMGLTVILLGVLWKNVGVPLPLAVVGAVFAACLCGFFNGLLITRVRVPPLIMTLATLALYRGLAEGISQARSVRGYPEWFFVLGQGEVLGVPTQLWILLRRRHRLLDRAVAHHLRPLALCDRLQRDGRALLRHQGRSHQAHHLHALRPDGGDRGRDLRVARLDDALRHGHGP